jgi:hypothetical protein
VREGIKAFQLNIAIWAEPHSHCGHLVLKSVDLAFSPGDSVEGS